MPEADRARHVERAAPGSRRGASDPALARAATLAEEAVELQVDRDRVADVRAVAAALDDQQPRSGDRACGLACLFDRYVLEGELLVHVEGEEHRVGTGGLFFAPPGVAHAFMVTSETAHVLGFQTPGSGERFYRDAGEPATGADSSRPADFDRPREVAEG